MIWNYIGGVGKIVAQLAIQVCLARMLGPEIFGRYAVILVVIGLGWLFADSGFGSALVQKETIKDEDIAYALGWVLLLSMITGLLVSVFSPLIASLIGDLSLKLPIAVCGIVIVLQALANLSASLMRRELDMKRYQIIQLSGYLIGFGVVAIALAYRGAGVWSLVIGFLVQTLINLVLCYLSVRHTLKPILNGDKALRDFGLKVLGTNISNWAIDNLDRFLIGRQWGISSLGAYAAASNLSRAPTAMLVSSIQSVVFSSAARVQTEPARLKRGYLAVVSLTALITFPLFLLLAYKAEFIIHLLYGQRWAEAIPLFSAFCVSVPLYVLLSITGPILWAIGAVGSEFKIQLFSATLLLIGLILLRNFPLKTVVWFIPCIYLLRLLLVYSVLAQKIGLKHLEVLRASLGGGLLAAAIILVEALVVLITPAEMNNYYIKDIFQILMAGLTCLLLIRAFPDLMFGKELSDILLARTKDSKLAKVICGLLALKVKAQ